MVKVKSVFSAYPRLHSGIFGVLSWILPKPVIQSNSPLNLCIGDLTHLLRIGSLPCCPIVLLVEPPGSMQVHQINETIPAVTTSLEVGHNIEEIKQTEEPSIDLFHQDILVILVRNVPDHQGCPSVWLYLLGVDLEWSSLLLSDWPGNDSDLPLTVNGVAPSVMSYWSLGGRDRVLTQLVLLVFLPSPDLHSGLIFLQSLEPAELVLGLFHLWLEVLRTELASVCVGLLNLFLLLSLHILVDIEIQQFPRGLLFLVLADTS